MKNPMRFGWIVFSICGLLLAATGGAEAAANPPLAKAGQVAGTSFEVTGRYTAQHRPRVTVLAFTNTNTGARETRYASSVEAMLVTFLKRKSQFVVVERKKLDLDRLFAEKEMVDVGLVQRNPDDEESRALLEKVNVFVLGSVTLLDVETSLGSRNEKKKAKPGEKERAEDEEIEAGFGDPDQTDVGDDTELLDTEDDEAITDEAITAGDSGEAPKSRFEKREEIRGARIELDVKLVQFDGRIIAAAQRSGPVACLRSIVERLGIALEQEYLRPYYGKLTVNLNEPEHVRVFLTPILVDDALDEEKPPAERSATVTIGSDYDVVEAWTTDPTTYTIKNVLSGWYSMRVERPGYSPIGVENARWEVRERLGREVVFDRVTNLPLEKIDPSISRFVVRVDPLTTEVVDGNRLKFTFRKEGGSIAPLIKRQYVDEDFARAPRRVILMGGEKIELNVLERPEEYADDERCDLFEERPPNLANYGRTHVAVGQSFNFSQFTGGELIIEDYQGEVVPVGDYRMALWEPSYKTETTPVTVHDLDDKKPFRASLTRETAALAMEPTGPRPANRVLLEGGETHHRIELPLDFEQSKELHGIPVDGYRTTTNITGLEGWQRSAVVLATNVLPPSYDTKSKPNNPKLIEAPRPKVEPLTRVGVKTRFGLAGRLEALSQRPDPLAADLFIDQDFLEILNLLLYGIPVRPGEERSDFWQAAAEAGRTLLPVPGVRASADSGGDLEIQFGVTPPWRSFSDRPPVAGEPTAGRRSSMPPKRFPRDPEVLRRLLAERLEYLDLVVLDPVDMVQLRRSPEVAGILARYIAAGGSLFAYVSTVGDYRQIVGTPFVIEDLSKRTRRLDLSPGEVEGLIPKLSRKEVKVKSRRGLPEVADLSSAWRILAYTRKGRRPRILERGGQAEGGYIALWLDDPMAFRSRRGGTRPKVEETRGRIEDHVIQQARNLMRLRFDRSASQALQPCTPSPVPSPN